MKLKIEKYNPPRPTNESGMMKVSYGDHFSRRITIMCKLDTVVKAIWEKLTKWQLKLLKDEIFGHFMKCQNFPFNSIIVHNMFLRQVAHRKSNEKDQLWFQMSENLIRLSVREWCQVTRLYYGKNIILKK